MRDTLPRVVADREGRMPHALAAACAVVVALVYFVWHVLHLSPELAFPWDFSVNWVAATGLRHQVSLYDWTALHGLAAQIVPGPYHDGLFTGLFTSYNNPPVTALLYLPFVPLPFDTAALLYRVAISGAFVAAVGALGILLPARDRARGWVLGLVALLVFAPVRSSLALGQVDAWVLLLIAGSLGLMGHRRPGWAGALAGAAAVLKLSPALLVGYYLLHRQWRAGVGAAAAGVGLLGLSAVVGRPQDLWTWAATILPRLSVGSLNAFNQAAPAFLSRLGGPDVEFFDYNQPLGPIRWITLALAVGLVVWLARAEQARGPRPLGGGLVVVAAMLAGPIAWIHYASWVLALVVLAADHRGWQAWPGRQRGELLAALGIGSALLLLPVLTPIPVAVAAQPTLRLLTGCTTLGALCWWGVTLALHIRTLSTTRDPAPLVEPAPSVALTR